MADQFPDEDDKLWQYDNAQWTQLPKHMNHLPLVTKDIDLFSRLLRSIWAFFLKFFFTFYIRLTVVGDIKKTAREHPKLLVISNHCSHLDQVSIAAATPLRQTYSLYAAAAKDYFFSNRVKSFFSKHMIGAIPIDRGSKRGEAIKLCLQMLEVMDRMWLIVFPEGTRSKDGKIHPFKRGVSLFAVKSNTSILFLYLDGAYKLFPKGKAFPRPGALKIHVGPVHPPGPIHEINLAYKKWVETINPEAFSDEKISVPDKKEQN
ncbi:MAG: lysophospholipid acyltransferase family protein [Bdellovibrionales bacterium]